MAGVNVRRAVEYTLPIIVFAVAFWLLSDAVWDVSDAYEAACGEEDRCESIDLDIWLLKLASIIAAFGLGAFTGWLIKAANSN